jgi:diguanylate cyclase (GGDEF)-like protein
MHDPIASGGWLTTYEDITERRKAEAKIAHMARYDMLTELPNRSFFREQMEHALRQVRRDEAIAVLCLDLDHFKEVNDALGHPVGDALLKEVAIRLRACIRESDVIARLGGDEFAIVKPSATGQLQEISVLAGRLIEAVSAPYLVSGQQVVVGLSIGIAISTTDGSSADELLKNADMALYRAKEDGRGIYRYFEPGMDARAQARRLLELDMRAGLANREFDVYYQPIVDLKEDRITALEALVRWNHPRRGLVPPDDFVPLAEDTGLIVQLGQWVLTRACADAVTWSRPVRVAVNFSPVQFKQRGLVEAVAATLASSGLPADRLEIEITEAVLLHDSVSTLATLHGLRALGVRISMDDFGTGYSSLSYLRSFPFDKIKIDQSFIHEVATRNESMAIVRAVTGLGSSLGITTTAEGVETPEQLQALRGEGCTEVQGYLYSRPRPAAEVEDMLAAKSASQAAA